VKQVRQPCLDGIETGIQALFGDEQSASKPARHGIRQRTLVLDLTPRGGDGSTES